MLIGCDGREGTHELSSPPKDLRTLLLVNTKRLIEERPIPRSSPRGYDLATSKSTIPLLPILRSDDKEIHPRPELQQRGPDRSPPSLPPSLASPTASKHAPLDSSISSALPGRKTTAGLCPVGRGAINYPAPIPGASST